ncbi:MAG TPA: hypothetical protein VN446_01505 [Candidatus Acidoferrum sp.]|nr:hypothetical protein [Candidatus Acidoferrum sp.]
MHITHPAKRRRAAAIVCCLLYCLFMALSFAYLAKEAHHDCAGHDCAVCATLRLLSNLLRAAAPAAAAAWAAACLLSGNTGRPCNSGAGRLTLVLQNVKLSE